MRQQRFLNTLLYEADTARLEAAKAGNEIAKEILAMLRQNFYKLLK
jgi:hypothetical protein